ARRDEHEDAGVRPGPADAPGVEQPSRVPFDRLAVERFHRHDRDLDAAVAVDRRQPRRERRPARGAQDAGVVADVAGWCRIGLGRDEAATTNGDGGKDAGHRPARAALHAAMLAPVPIATRRRGGAATITWAAGDQAIAGPQGSEESPNSAG